MLDFSPVRYAALYWALLALLVAGVLLSRV